MNAFMCFHLRDTGKRVIFPATSTTFVEEDKGLLVALTAAGVTYHLSETVADLMDMCSVNRIP